RLASMPDQERILGLLHRAKVEVDRAGIFTIHGFAARMLSDHAFESGTRDDTELTGDERSLVQDLVTDFWSAEVAVLPQATFQLFGGTLFFHSLVRVALAASSSEGVPLVEVEQSENLDDRLSELAAIYEEVRPQFLEQSGSLRDLLLRSASLDRNKFRPNSVERDYVEYCSYFDRGDPSVGHPKSERFTQRKVDASIKRNALPVNHPLLTLLERLHDADARVKVAAREHEDHLRAKLCRIVRERVGKEHGRRGTQSFDGLLKDLSSALKKPGQGQTLAAIVRASWPVALIDEFQDTDPIQYEIFRDIYVQQAESSKARALYLIGDPKQSIYAFRGADVHTYLR